MNEIDGMRAVLPRINKSWVDEIIIVDGGSTDGSIEYARSLGFRVHVQNFKGVIPAWITAVELASSDYVIFFSPDNNSIPEKIPELVAKTREGYDMVVVSRYLDGATSEDDSPLTRFGNWFFTSLANLIHGTNYTDLMVIFRCLRRDLCKELKIIPWKSIHTQLGLRCKTYNKKVAEIAGNEPPRLGGISKRSILWHGLTELYTIIIERFIKENGRGFY